MRWGMGQNALSEVNFLGLEGREAEGPTGCLDWSLSGGKKLALCEADMVGW